MSQPSSPQRRRDKRYPARLPIRTRVAGRLKDLFSEDVSYRGLFLATDSPPPLRQLIRIETVLPPGGTNFATHAMVVHVVSPGDPGVHGPGFGVQFYGMGNERRAWEAFVQYVQQSAPALPDHRESRPPLARSSLATGSVRIGHGSAFHRSAVASALPVVIELRPPDVEELYRLYSRDVSAGGMFLSTARDIEVGSEVRLDVRHPLGASVFHLTAVVRRRSGEPATGIGVEFTGLDDGRRRAFFEFIHAPLAVPDEMDDELELVENDDRG